MAVGSLEALDPNLALREGLSDSKIVLALWCLRKSFFPLFWLGLCVVVFALGDLERLERELPSLDDPGDLISSLLSPFGVLVVAIGVRIASNILALAAAFPLTLRTKSDDYGSGWRAALWLRVWWDRVRLAGAYRSLRWTWAVRDVARKRLEASARPFTVCELALRWLSVVLVVALFVLLALRSG